MINLKNRTILDCGTVICTENSAVDILYNGKDLENVILNSSDIANEFNEANKLLDTNFEYLNSGTESIYKDIDWFNLWLTPDSYKNIDVKEYCLNKCKTGEQINRILYEIELFTERNMIPILQHLLYLVNHFRSNEIIWGVGRGSGVSSLILYLIGITRIDPLKYNLDIHEFLR
jgi:DNA polymerase III alpha subunit